MASVISAGTTSGTAIAIAGDTSGVLQLQTNGTTAAVTIDTSQRVGIGTSSPTDNLYISRATNSAGGISVVNTNNAQASQIAQLYLQGGDNAYAQIKLQANSVNSSIRGNNDGSLAFLSSTTERMRIDSSGNAMIGTTTAGLKLTVQDGVTIVSGDQSTCRLVLQNTTSPGRTFSLIAGTVGVGNDDFTIFDNTASATRVILKANGEFIIGTSDQGPYNLQCNGTGVWGAGAYVNGSDARIKEDIAPIESGLDVVEKLNPVTYRYKEDWSKDQSTQTGFIAQELLTALNGQVYVDGVVQQGGENQYMSVAYQNIIPILTKAIQELNAKVEAQAVRIAELEGAK
jgi:hypothetical protein